MIHHRFKKILLSISLFLLILFNSVPAFAVACPSASDFDSNNSRTTLRLEYILCPLGRFLNIALFLVGVVFVGLLAWGAIKLSLAVGDVKKFDDVKSSWTWLVFGFLIVVGFFLIVRIVSGVLGITFTTPFGIFVEMQTRMYNFISTNLWR